MASVFFTVVLAVCACALLIESFARAHAERGAVESLRQLSADFRDALDRGMAQQLQEIRVLAKLEPFRRFDDPASVRRALDEAQAGFPHFAWLGLTDAQGRVLAAGGGLLEGADVSGRPWWQAAQREVYVGDVHAAVLLERLLPPLEEPWRFVDFAVPIKAADGALQGVFGAHLSWAWARRIKHELIDSALHVHDAQALVLSRDGTVLLGPPGTEGRPLDDLRPALLQTSATTQQMRADGQPWFVVTASTRGQGDYPGLGWVVLLRKPVNVALDDYFQLRRQIGFAALGLVALFVPLAWLLSRRLAAPLVDLAAAVSARQHLGEAQRLPRVRGLREAELLSDALADLSERQALQDALLERRVAERTEALQHANARLEASEQRLEQLTRIDSLTGLANRRQFSEQLPQAMARSRRNGSVMALLYLDLDRFKAINDSHGHAAGDAVLKEFARRLMACVRETDLVGRLGGDEFVLIIEGAPTADEPERVARKILSEMAPPFDIDGQALPVATSIGVACYRNEEGLSDEQLLGRADAALYEAKAAGRGTYKVAAMEASIAAP